LIQYISVTDGQMDRLTDSWTMAKTRETLHAVARKMVVLVVALVVGLVLV